MWLCINTEHSWVCYHLNSSSRKISKTIVGGFFLMLIFCWQMHCNFCIFSYSLADFCKDIICFEILQKVDKCQHPIICGSGFSSNIQYMGLGDSWSVSWSCTGGQNWKKSISREISITTKIVAKKHFIGVYKGNHYFLIYTGGALVDFRGYSQGMSGGWRGALKIEDKS